MLGTQLNDKVHSKEIEVKAIVQLDKYICNVIQETRSVEFTHTDPKHFCQSLENKSCANLDK